MTPDRPPASATRLKPFHSSTRTALSLNTDGATGQRTQALATSRLEMHWVAGELHIACRTSRMVMDAERVRSVEQRTRGAL